MICSFFITNCEISAMVSTTIKSRDGSAIEYYDDFSLNATHLLVKNMKLASIKRIQEQSLVRKMKQDVMDSMHLKRQKLITKVVDRSSVEVKAKESRRKYYLSQLFLRRL